MRASSIFEQGLVCFASEGRRTLVKVSSAEPATHDVEVIWDVLESFVLGCLWACVA